MANINARLSKLEKNLKSKLSLTSQPGSIVVVGVSDDSASEFCIADFSGTNHAESIQIPEKLAAVFAKPGVRFRSAWGGRGSGKTQSFALMVAVRAYIYARQGVSGMIVCAREHCNSLDESTMQELKDAILGTPWLADAFDVGVEYIRSKNRLVRFSFTGLRRNINSIKSKKNVLLLWVDEAEEVSERAWQIINPSVRAAQSEIWVTWNPESLDSATDRRFRQEAGGDCAGVEVNHSDNPWFPDVLEKSRLSDKDRLSDALYRWIWEGDYLAISEASVLFGKVVVADLDGETEDWDDYYGADFGYQDPATLVRVMLDGDERDTLYISHEAYKRRVGTPNLPALYDAVPGHKNGTIWADSSRPDSIAELCSFGLDVRGAEKGANSVSEGVHWLLGFRRIVIHPRCVHAIDESNKWRWKVDRHTGEILGELVDKDNHVWDAVRYATREVQKNGRGW